MVLKGFPIFRSVPGDVIRAVCRVEIRYPPLRNLSQEPPSLVMAGGTHVIGRSDSSKPDLVTV